AGDGCFLAGLVPARNRTPRRQQRDAVDAELGELLHGEVRLGPFRERERDDEARFEPGLDDRRALGVQVDGPRTDAHDRVGAPTPVAVGGGDDFAPAEAPHPAQVMPGLGVDRDVLVERANERVRGLRITGREAERYWQADRTRSHDQRSSWTSS